MRVLYKCNLYGNGGISLRKRLRELLDSPTIRGILPREVTAKVNE